VDRYGTLVKSSNSALAFALLTYVSLLSFAIETPRRYLPFHFLTAVLLTTGGKKLEPRKNWNRAEILLTNHAQKSNHSKEHPQNGDSAPLSLGYWP
jgi:hypothetical protein